MDNPEVIALAKAHGFEENVEMGGAYFSKTFANGRTLLVNNGEYADYPETPDSYIEWAIVDENWNVVNDGNFFSFREFLNCQWVSV